MIPAALGAVGVDMVYAAATGAEWPLIPFTLIEVAGMAMPVPQSPGAILVTVPAAWLFSVQVLQLARGMDTPSN